MANECCCLQPGVLPDVLGQVNTAGVRLAVLMTTEGELLGSAGETTNEKIIGAIVANIWQSYSSCGEAILKDNQLNILLLENEEGRVAVAKVARSLLCLVANQDVELGLLKAKLEGLRDAMAGPLSSLSPKGA